MNNKYRWEVCVNLTSGCGFSMIFDTREKAEAAIKMWINAVVGPSNRPVGSVYKPPAFINFDTLMGGYNATLLSAIVSMSVIDNEQMDSVAKDFAGRRRQIERDLDTQPDDDWRDEDKPD